MAKDYAQRFYSSEAWNQCREGYRKSKGGLCEECLKQGVFTPGEIVHHKIQLTPENIHRPEISLDWSNLELVCRICHAKKHGHHPKRYFVDGFGRVTAR